MKAAYTGSRLDVRRLVQPDAKRILDVGCASGAIGRELKRDAPDRYVVGLEGDGILASEAAKHLDQVIVCDLNFSEFWSSFAEVNNDIFDCIILADVLEHLVDPSRMLSKLVEERLTDNGTVIISLPNVCHILTIGAVVRQRWPTKSSGLFDETHLRWFCWSNIESLLEQASLELIVVTRNLRLFDDWKDSRNRFVRFLRFSPVVNFVTYQYVLSAKRK